MVNSLIHPSLTMLVNKKSIKVAPGALVKMQRIWNRYAWWIHTSSANQVHNKCTRTHAKTYLILKSWIPLKSMGKSIFLAQKISKMQRFSKGHGTLPFLPGNLQIYRFLLQYFHKKLNIMARKVKGKTFQSLFSLLHALARLKKSILAVCQFRPPECAWSPRNWKDEELWIVSIIGS